MSKLIEISQKYNRSTNLELDYHDKDKLKGIFLTNKFETGLIELLDSINEKNSNQRVRVVSGSPGLGKSTYALCSAQLVSRFDDLKGVEAVLATTNEKKVKALLAKYHEFKKSKKKLLPVFINGYQGDIETVFVEKLQKSLFDAKLKKIPYEAKKESPIDYFKRVSGEIKKSNYAGIFVVYDEFGKYLEKGIHSPSLLNIQFLQDFAEYCDRSGQEQCHLILITHLSVSQYASQLPINIQKEWAKIEGRFQESSFYDKTTDYYKMIASTFRSHLREKTYKKIYNNVSESVNTVHKALSKNDFFDNYFESQDIQNKAIDCYPLHPITLAYLPLLSQRVAQNERTLFTFLTRNEDSSLPRFLADKFTEDKICFLGVEELYNYFRPLIAKDYGVGGTHKIGLLLENALDGLEKEDQVSRKILILIAINDIIKNQRFALSCKEFFVASLADQYTPKEVEKALDDLAKKKVISFNKFSKKYELVQGSSIDLSEEIEKLKGKKLTSKELIRVVRSYFKVDYITPKRYNLSQKITRFYRAEILSLEEFQRLSPTETNVSYGEEDGRCLYVIPFDHDELVVAKNIVKKFSSRLVTVVLPESFIECRSDIEELHCVDALFNDRELLTTGGPLVKKELDRYKSTLLQSIRSLLSPLLGTTHLEAVLHYQSSSKRISSYTDLQRALGDFFELEYDRYVAINSELINKHKIATPVILARKKLSDHLKTGEEFVGNGPEVALKKLLTSLAQYEINEKRKITISSRSIIFDLFKSYKEILLKNPRGISFEELSNVFIAPPYGLRKATLPMLLSLFDKALDHPINHYFEQEFVESVDGEHYEMLLKHPQKCTIKYTEISKNRQFYMSELAKTLNCQANLNDIITAIFSWRKNVPDYTKNAETTPANGKKVILAIDAAKEPDTLIFIKIPNALGFSTVDDIKSNDELSLLVQEFSKQRELLLEVYKDLIRDLFGQILKSLSEIETSILRIEATEYVKGMSLPLIYQEALRGFSQELKDFPYTKMTIAFIGRIKTFDSSRATHYFVENLADALTGTNPRYWDHRTRSVFEHSLKKVLEEIVAVAEYLQNTNGQESAIAFINKDSGEKRMVNLGVMTPLNPKMNDAKLAVDTLLKDFEGREVRNILAHMLLECEGKSAFIALKGNENGISV